MRTAPKPDVFRYLSYRSYLEQWFQVRKQADSRYSYRLFSKRAGVRSPSLLKEIIQGKRNITDGKVDGFIQALGLDEDEAAFFVDLVTIDQATRAKDRTAALQRIAATQRFRRARPLDHASVAYLSSWTYPTIRELAFRDDFQFDAAWVGQQLQPPISEEAAGQALELLKEHGFLEQRQDGRWQPGEASLATAHEAGRALAMAFHQQMLERAQEALVTVPSAERHLSGVTVLVSKAQVQNLKAEINRFQEQIMHLCDEHTADGDQVYQVSVQLIPLTQTKGRA